MNEREEVLGEVRRRRGVLRDARGADVGDEALLERQLAELERDLGGSGPFPDENWEQHELHWNAHAAELRRSMVRQTAHIVMAFEDMRRKNPVFGVCDPAMEKILSWWMDEGGREEFLGSITIEERRALEEMERGWREKDP